MILATVFTNFGPYHLARLRALAARLAAGGGRLIAVEVARQERLYPWQVERADEPFTWVTLFDDRPLEALTARDCRRATRRVLNQFRPDAVAVAGYARPESMAALRWAERRGRPAILMSETQRIDHRRVWWKEAIKARRVRRFDAALVGGPSHRDYLAGLGMPRDRIALGYNAVDNAAFAAAAEAARRDPAARHGLPGRPYFLAVSRFAPEKNLTALVWAFAAYRAQTPDDQAWDLALCGDGPGAGDLEGAVAASGLDAAVHRPGFLQARELPRWYAFASAFVHPSRMEPWGLVVNEAAACGLPLLVTERAGCVETLVPDPPGTTGRRFDPTDEAEMTEALGWIASLPEAERRAMGRRAARVVADWGPARFAEGMRLALEASASVALASFMEETP